MVEFNQILISLKFPLMQINQRYMHANCNLIKTNIILKLKLPSFVDLESCVLNCILKIIKSIVVIIY